jgi:hypothetical protein
VLLRFLDQGLVNTACTNTTISSCSGRQLLEITSSSQRTSSHTPFWLFVSLLFLKSFLGPTVVDYTAYNSNKRLREIARHPAILASAKRSLICHFSSQHCHFIADPRPCALDSATWHGPGAQPPRNLFEDVHQRAHNITVLLYHSASRCCDSAASSKYHQYYVYLIRFQECCVLCELGASIHQCLASTSH